MHFDGRSETPWEDSEVFGTLLEREEALAHPRRADFLEVAEFVVLHDQRLREHLGE